MGDPWVEWAAACVATPSVSFADISPSRGEIDPRQAPRSNAVSEHADAKAGLRTMSALHPISTLEGEMSGRTEGSDLVGIRPSFRGDHDVFDCDGELSVVRSVERRVGKERVRSCEEGEGRY